MLIIREDSLNNVGGNILYKGKNFDGVAIAVVNGVVEDKKSCKNGVFCGDYISPYIISGNSCPSIDSAGLDNEYEEPCTRNGSLFSGIAYRFEGDICISECEYEDGWLISEVNYRVSGGLESVDVGSDDLSQKCSWFECGGVKEFESFRRDFYRFWVKFSDVNVITTLVIEGDYFSHIEKTKDQLKFNMFDNDKFASNLIGADYLFISGSGVNDQIFESLLFHGGLEGTKKLSITKTSISPSVLAKLAYLENLEKLLIESNTIDMDAMKKFKRQRPDCFVEFNREEVFV